MSSKVEQIISKLDAFIRKFYLNQILRGSIYFLTFSFLFVLFILSAEYFGEFGSTTRTILFYGSILTLASILFQFILRPLFKYLKIGSLISHEQAAMIIGEHFAEVNDKLKNLLQLSQKEINSSSDLLLASIEQKQLI